MSGDRTTTTSQNTSSAFPDWTQTAGKGLFDSASTWFQDNPTRASYTGPWSAAQTGDTQNASDALTKMLGSGSDLSNASGGYKSVLDALNPNASTQDLMNPFVDATLQPTIRNLNLAHDTAARGIGASATSAGAFGDTGHAMLASQNDKNTAQQIGDATATANSGAFDRAQQQKNAIMSQIMGASSGLQGAATAKSGIANLLAQLGLGQQQFQQQGIQNQLGEFDKGADYPMKNMTTLASLLAMIPKNTTGTSAGTQTSPDNSGIGLLGSMLSYAI